ncbi:DegT/DnrJ/EryC1/StrS family aminotransferase [Hominenteromicrobium sp.]|uniref:DegT/DnrJ/EryC1/StrS family aminotransferase n=1 Tax=Hominenteromicrobium sp. TaxID=3073581 RepID=UPI00399203D8
MRKIPFSPPDISELEIQEVCEALRSGWITTGPRTKKLEQKLAQYCHTDKMVCLNSATAAEELNLRVLGIGPGDEVLVPAYTYTASASAAIHTGATVRFIDCQENSLEMDYDRMEAAITEKTKAVIPVDLGGIPCDYDRIYEAVERKKDLFRPNSEIQKAMGRIAVVADCAHALGAEKNGEMTGALADFSSFSFHAVKNFTTAEGGASCWKTIPGVDNDELYHQYQLLSLHGQSKDALAKTKLGAWEYDIVGPWYKCNMTDIMAAIGLKQLERYPGLLQRRAEIIRRYDAALKPLGVETLTHFGEDYRSSGHLYITRVPNITEQQRNDIIVKMAEREIACNVHFKPLPMMTAYKTLGFDIEDYPNAYKHYANEITLPLHTKLSDEDVAYVIENFTEILKEYL